MQSLDTKIGDGIYVRYDGFAVRLRNYRTQRIQEVSLEPLALCHFLEFIAKLGAKDDRPV